jgi:hypothetical protein
MGRKMKIITFFLILSSVAFTQPVYVNCASGTLGQTYSGATPSLQAAFTNIPVYVNHLAIINSTGVNICATPFNIASAPLTFTANEHCTVANSTMAWDGINTINTSPIYIYIRADQASCTTGGFYVDVW